MASKGSFLSITLKELTVRRRFGDELLGITSIRDAQRQESMNTAGLFILLLLQAVLIP